MTKSAEEVSDPGRSSGGRTPFGGEQHFERVFESAALGMGIVSLDGHWLNVNPALCEITGYSEDELTSKTFQEMTHPDDLETDLSQASLLLDSKIRSYEMEKRYFHADGRLVWVLLSVSLVRDGAGAPMHFIAQVQDITHHKSAVQQLKENEEKYRLALETLSDGFAILSAVRDQEGSIVDFRYEFVNRAGCRLNRRTKEEQIGHTLLELLPAHRDAGILDDYIAVVEGERSLVKEALVYEDEFGGGKHLARAFDIRASKFGDGVAMTWRDVTERKQLDIAKDEFAANAAHELRTPLSILSGYAITLGTRRHQMSLAQFDEALDAVQRQGERLTALIGNLLDLSRIRVDELRKRKVNVRDVVDHALANLVTPPGVMVEIDISNDLVVETDPAPLDQVVTNLLTNAFNYGGPLVTVSGRAESDEVVLAVTDNGPGVPSRFTPILFEPFTRATHHSGTAGSGLGLAISWRLAKSMGGGLAYSPARPSGSTFELRIPR